MNPVLLRPACCAGDSGSGDDLTLVRLCGPTAQDCVLALDCMALNGMLLMLVVGIHQGSSNYFEAALLVARCWFPIGSMAMAGSCCAGR